MASIGVADGHVTVVELDCDGGMETVAADHIVNAAGAWAGRIGAMAGVDIPMRPSKGALVAVENERVDRVISRARLPGDADSGVPIGGELC